MRTERVSFFSDGLRLAALLRLPDRATGPFPALVHPPGWLGLAGSNHYQPWHEGLTAAGYAVLAFDYRGFGESEGPSGWVRPDWQIEDTLSAVTYLASLGDVNARQIGAYSMGGTGVGNAIIAAALDQRIRGVAGQTPVADGADWLHRMRREYEWVDFLRRLEADRRRWVLEGEGERVDPRQELMVAAPEREASGAKKDADAALRPDFYLRSAEYLLRYRPLDHVAQIAPRGLLLTAVENDAVTPEDHAVALFQAAGRPKKLVRQTGTSHYASYVDNYEPLLAHIVDWFGRCLAPGSPPVEVEEVVDLPTHR
jgi:dipeptidyl aminopeptidase/acylaminoacyl peptidase